jgi:hypothetical protein
MEKSLMLCFGTVRLAVRHQGVSRLEQTFLKNICRYKFTSEPISQNSPSTQKFERVFHPEQKITALVHVFITNKNDGPPVGAVNIIHSAFEEACLTPQLIVTVHNSRIEILQFNSNAVRIPEERVKPIWQAA